MPALRAHCRIWWRGLVSFYTGQGPEHAGNLAFLGMLALFPFLIFLLALSGLFGQTEAGQDAVQALMANLPPEIAETLAGPMRNVVEASGGGILTGSLIFLLWPAMNGVSAARKAVIHAYGSWEHAAPAWRRLMGDLGLVVLAAILIPLSMSLIVLLPVAITTLDALLPLPDVVRNISLLGRVVIAPLLLFLAVLGLYRSFTPNMPEQRRYYLPGAALAGLVWIGLGKAMAVFLARADRYDLFYGSLAGVVLLQIFLFVLAIVFIYGAHLNAAYSRTRAERVED